MKRKIGEYLLLVKTNKLFKKTMKSYFIIAFMVFLAYALVMVFNVYHAAIKQLTDAERKMLSQAETTNDFILRNVNSAADDVFENDILAISAMTSPYDQMKSYEITTLISSIKRQTAAIDKVYFFNLKDDCIYTGENPVYNKESFPDKELLELVSTKSKFIINLPHILKYAL